VNRHESSRPYRDQTAPFGDSRNGALGARLGKCRDYVILEQILHERLLRRGGSPITISFPKEVCDA
jgi:hypothetical protein